MHICENYSSKLLCKIDKPILLEKFYPVPEKYIVLNIGGAMLAKVYDYWSICLEFLIPELAKNNIQVIQLGDDKEPRLKGTIYLAGQTDFHQSTYIVHNAALHVGTDSALVHIASAFNTPILATYSVSGPELCGPYWGDKSKQILLEPNFKENQSYSYNPNEPIKSINTIKPEQIVEAIGKLLNIPFPNFETIFIGPRFNQICNELIPNCQIPVQYFPNSQLSIRADWEILTPEITNNIYSTIFARPCSLRINKELELNPILQNPQIKKNLVGILLDLSTDSFSEDYVKSLLDNQIKFILAYGVGTRAAAEDEDFLKKLKLKFCEFGVIQKFEKENGELRKIFNSPDFSPDGIFAKSNRVLVSDSKLYLSKICSDDKLSVDQTQKLEFALGALRNWRQLPEDSDFLYIYRKIN